MESIKAIKAPLCEMLGETPTLRLLAFLIAHANFDYSKAELARNLNLSRQTIYKALEPLLKFNIVVESRKIGNTTLYKLSPDSEPVNAFIGLNETIVSFIIDNELNIDVQGVGTIDDVMEQLRRDRKGS